jgi:hypothetical protein
MSGTRIGGLKSAKINKAKYGEDFYQRVGALGGAACVPKGFSTSGKASEAGKLGGTISSRRKDIKRTGGFNGR